MIRNLSRPEVVGAALAVVLLFAPEVGVAGAWLQAPGASYVKASWLHLSADRRSGCAGGVEDVDGFGGSYREDQAFVYGEIGLSRKVTLVGSFALKDARIVDGAVPDYGTRSSGDVRVGARVGVLTGALPVSVETVLSLPTYPESDPSDPVGVREQFLPAGTGTVDFESRIQAGLSLHPLPLYVSAEAGVRARGGPYGDQWLLGLEVGAATSRVFAKSDLRGVIGHGEICGAAAVGAVTINERVWNWAPEVAFRVGEDLWLGGGVSVPFAGRNALDGPQWSLSLAWQRRAG